MSPGRFREDDNNQGIDRSFTHQAEAGPQAGLKTYINTLWTGTMEHGGFSISPERKIVFPDPAQTSGILRRVAMAVESYLPSLTEAELSDLSAYLNGLHQHPSNDAE